MAPLSIRDVLEGPDPGQLDPGGLRAVARDAERAAARLAGDYARALTTSRRILEGQSSRVTHGLTHVHLDGRLTLQNERIRASLDGWAASVTAYVREVSTLTKRTGPRRRRCAHQLERLEDIIRELGTLAHLPHPRWDRPPASLPPAALGDPTGATATRWLRLVDRWQDIRGNLVHERAGWRRDQETREQLDRRLRDMLEGDKQLRRATSAIRHGAGALLGVSALLPSGARLPDTTRLAPTLRGMSTADQRAWWNELPLAAQRDLAERDPDYVGELPWASGQLRDRANRNRLDRDIARLEAEITDYWAGNRRNASPDSRASADRAIFALGTLSATTARLRELRNIRNALRREGKAPRRWLLSLPHIPRDGQTATVGAVIAVGSLPTVDGQTAVLVPGMNARTGSLPNLVEGAGHLHDAAARAGARDPSVVVWLGYETPTALEEPHLARARAGGARLSAFLEQLTGPGNLTRERITVVAHSYGSTTAAQALTEHGAARHVDRLVTVGSAGIAPTQLDRVGDVRIFATEAAEDAWAPVGRTLSPQAVVASQFEPVATLIGASRKSTHPVDPREHPAVTVFSSDGAVVNGERRDRVQTHTLYDRDGDGDLPGQTGQVGYLSPGAESLEHLGSIIAHGRIAQP